MKKLEKLMQDESGILHHENGRVIHQKNAITKGKIRPLVMANPVIDISIIIDEMAEQNSVFIPQGANAYVASDFSGDTQHLRKSDLEGHEKFYSVFAVQFYYVSIFS